jgi:acyl-coenzyme A synthetase/AMP-(fatty) acid ligase
LGCEKSQSALDPAGRAAEQIARLFWKMAIGTVLVWLAMVGLTLYAMRGEPLQHEPPKALQRAQEERLLKTWETPMGWRYDRQAPQAGANARRRALLSVTSAAWHSANSG